MTDTSHVISSRDLSRLSRALPFWMSLCLPPLAWVGAIHGGWTVLLLPVVTWWMFSVLDALAGAIYLFIAIGLYGKSRFTLFVAIGFPLATGLFAAANYPNGPWLSLRLALDAVTIMGAGLVLLHRDTGPSP